MTESTLAAPLTPEQPSKKPRSIGKAALMFGIIGLVLAFIPYVSWIGFASAILGTLLGGIGISAKRKSWPGAIVSVVALILSLVMGLVYAQPSAPAKASASSAVAAFNLTIDGQAPALKGHEAGARTVAKEFCKNIKALGYGPAITLESQDVTDSGVTVNELGAILGAGVPTFCPQYSAAQKKWDSSN